MSASDQFMEYAFQLGEFAILGGLLLAIFILILRYLQ